MSEQRDPLRRAIVLFVAASVVVLAIVGVVGVLVLARVSADEATRRAEDTAIVAARAVQERLTNGIVQRRSTSLVPIDALVTAGVLRDPIEDVTLRLPDGEIVFSSATDRIGTTDPLDSGEREAMGGAIDRPAVADSERDGALVVSLPVSTPDGTELLFQADVRSGAVAATSRRLWTAMLPVLVATLLALAALLVPLGVRLARRVRDSQQERARLLQHAVDASTSERRRIAGELHDGLGQQLVGLSMTLSAEADAIEPTDPAAAARLRAAADRTRDQMRSLRSALLGIYPPSLERAGLGAALEDLSANLRADDVAVQVDVPDDLAIAPTTEALLFRGAREAVRNVTTHARASSVRIAVAADDERASISVRDDGVGFDPTRRDALVAEGHLGLAMLEDLARERGGELRIETSPGAGTTLLLEAPVAAGAIV
jgi:signal transduction histidine kinase